MKMLPLVVHTLHSLYLMCPVVERMTVWVLLWIAVTTDFVIKFATVIVKAAIALLPRQILPMKKKVCSITQWHIESGTFMLYIDLTVSKYVGNLYFT